MDLDNNIGQQSAPETTIEQPSEPGAPKLVNPFEDDAEPAYIQIETPEGTTFKHASAGKAVEKEVPEKTLWQRMREENIEKYNSCRWGRWGTKTEWDDARWMAKARLSQASLDELRRAVTSTHQIRLNLRQQRNCTTLSIMSLARLPGQGGATRRSSCPKPLFGTPRFAGKMALGPVVKCDKDGIREYSQVNTADHWNLVFSARVGTWNHAWRRDPDERRDRPLTILRGCASARGVHEPSQYRQGRASKY